MKTLRRLLVAASLLILAWLLRETLLLILAALLAWPFFWSHLAVAVATAWLSSWYGWVRLTEQLHESDLARADDARSKRLQEVPWPFRWLG